MIKTQIVSGKICLQIPIKEDFSTSVEDDQIYDYIEKHIYDYVQEVDKDDIEIIDIDIDDVQIEEYAGDDEYGI